MTKQLEVTVRVRNNLLIDARLRLGFKTQAAATRAIGLSPLQLNDYECLRVNPVSKKTGTWRAIAVKISDFYGISPDELWPEAIREIRGAATLTAYTDVDELCSGLVRTALPANHHAEKQELVAVVGRALREIDPRAARIIRNRFGFDREPMTLQELSEREDISRERVRQIFDRGMQRLRRERLLAPAIDWHEEV